MSASDYAKVLKKIDAGMRDLGFVRQRKELYIKQTAPGIFEMIAISRHFHPDGVALDPYVGVYYENIQLLIAKFMHQKFRRWDRATHTIGLMNLDKRWQYTRWFIRPTSDCQKIVIRMFNDIRSTGLPYMHKMCQLSSLLKLPKRSIRHLRSELLVYPIALILAGRSGTAIKYVKSQSRRMSDKEYRVFAKSLERFALKQNSESKNWSSQ